MEECCSGCGERVGHLNYCRMPSTPVRHPSSQHFHDILKDLGDLHDRKQASYGTPDDPFNNYRATAGRWGLPAWEVVAIRASEKIDRLAALIQKAGTPADGETICETLDDIGVLAVIARVMYEEEEKSLDTDEIGCQINLVDGMHYGPCKGSCKSD